MYIAAHKLKNRNELLFVFNFATEEEMFNLIKDWKSHSVGLVDLTEKGYWLALLDKIEARADAKYAREGVALSSSLFQDEFVAFSMYASWLLACAVPYENAKGLSGTGG